LTDLAEQAFAEWQHDEHEQVVAELQQASRQDQVAWGLSAAWRAVVDRSAEHVWVEHDFARPGRVVAGVEGIEITADPAEPGVVDDLVDALIAKAHDRGISVDVLEPGTLNRGEPIAAKIHSTGAVRSDRDPKAAESNESAAGTPNLLLSVG
jgi:hypothetical protein